MVSPLLLGPAWGRFWQGENVASLLDSVPGVIFKIFHLCASQEVTEIPYSFQYKLFSPPLKNFLKGNGSHLQQISIFYFWHEILDLFLTICELPEKLWKDCPQTSPICIHYSVTWLPSPGAGGVGWLPEGKLFSKALNWKLALRFSNFKRKFVPVSPALFFKSSQLFKHQTQFSILCYLIYIYILKEMRKSERKKWLSWMVFTFKFSTSYLNPWLFTKPLLSQIWCLCLLILASSLPSINPSKRHTCFMVQMRGVMLISVIRCILHAD